MCVVTLGQLTDDGHGAFVEEEIANYGDQQVRDAGWPRAEALERGADAPETQAALNKLLLVIADMTAKPFA